MTEDSTRLNNDIGEHADMETACQFALYPMGTDNYMEVIYAEVNRAKAAGTFAGGVHYASRWTGPYPGCSGHLKRRFCMRSNPTAVIWS